MHTFNIGDKVRRINEPWTGVEVGEIYVVAGYSSFGVLSLEGKECKYDPTYFELVLPSLEDQIREAEEKLAALKKQKQKEEQETVTYRIGQRFTGGTYGDEYILAQVDSECACLINLETGVNWVNPVFVGDVFRIKQEDWKVITDECVFTLVK